MPEITVYKEGYKGDYPNLIHSVIKLALNHMIKNKLCRCNWQDD